MSKIPIASPTIFCDIDGTLLHHYNNGIIGQINNSSKKINNTKEAILHWDKCGYQIILVTGRKESLREFTNKQLIELCIPYDKLIMGLTNGDRIIINDKKNHSIRNTAYAMNLVRNNGMHENQYKLIDFNTNSNYIPDNEKYLLKPWGSETLIEQNDQYVVKKLHMNKGCKCSLQYHILKKETIYVLSGQLKLHLGERLIDRNGDYIDGYTMLEPKIMNPGDTITIEPMRIHRMEGIEASDYLETSTNELWDVVRLEDDYKRI